MQVRNIMLAGIAAIGLTAPAAAMAQDWDHGGYHENGWRRGGDEGDHWRDHERREAWREHGRREEWREHRPGGYGYYGYAPAYYGYYRSACRTETRPTYWGGYEVVRRCR